PTTGETAILGVLSGTTAARRPVGYLPEDHRFPEYRTAEGLIHFYGTLSGMPSAALRTRTAELLEQVGLSGAAQKKVRGFSKGMKQRLGLAQAMVHDPDVIFLDEPTDGVDPKGRAEIREVLSTLKQQGKTIFLNSHLLSEVEQICDRVGILHQGVLVREGATRELTRSEGSFVITTKPAPDEATLAALREKVVALTCEGDSLEVQIEREDDIDGVVDLLRSRSIGIRTLNGKKLTLEQVFLQVIGTEAAPGGAR
ncbi:MAG: ABC transporter ATP-binding protein, partial [Planctomycetota bacterium]